MTFVLVVDDETTLTEMLRELLLEEGYDVAIAHDGKAALAYMAERLPDVVLTDVMMPRMSGWDLYRAIRVHPDYRQVPVVLMSAGAELVGRDAAADGDRPPVLVRKPFEIDELLDALVSATGQAVPGSV